MTGMGYFDKRIRTDISPSFYAGVELGLFYNAWKPRLPGFYFHGHTSLGNLLVEF